MYSSNFCLYVCIYMYAYVCMYICMYVCMYVCMYMKIFEVSFNWFVDFEIEASLQKRLEIIRKFLDKHSTMLKNEKFVQELIDK